MRRLGRKALQQGLVLVVLAAIAAFGGCGSGGPDTETIRLTSAAVDGNGVIKPNFVCGGGSLWLPLDWGPVSSDAKELAIYMGRFKYVKTSHGGRKLVVPFADLVSHINPSLRHLVANTIPTGASWSYFGSISCLPARGQHILQEVFVLDRRQLNRQLKRPLATRLTREALSQDRADPSSRSPGKLTEDTAAIGRLITTYGTPPSGKDD